MLRRYLLQKPGWTFQLLYMCNIAAMLALGAVYLGTGAHNDTIKMLLISMFAAYAAASPLSLFLAIKHRHLTCGIAGGFIPASIILSAGVYFLATMFAAMRWWTPFGLLLVGGVTLVGGGAVAAAIAGVCSLSSAYRELNRIEAVEPTLLGCGNTHNAIE